MLSRLKFVWKLSQSLRLRDPLLRRASAASGDPSSSSIISYLVNSWGVSPELAPAVAKKAAFKSPEKADAVLEFLRSRGFNQAQVAECVRKDPKLLQINAEKFLKRKFEALEGSGLSQAFIAELVSRQPKILKPSAKRGLISAVVAYVRTLVPNESDFVRLLRRCPWIIGYVTLARIKPNVDLLLSEGVPLKHISYWFYWKPLFFADQPARFVKLVQIVKDMGFTRPSVGAFVVAIMARTVEKKWDDKIRVYKSFGLSEDEIMAAFRVEPQILITSEDKIRKMMGYFVGVKGIDPCVVMKDSYILLKVSLEKRVIPRYKVMEVLTDRGIVHGWSYKSVFKQTEKVFLANYVTKHKEKIPELWNLYSAEVNR